MPTASDVLPEIGMSIKNFFRAITYPLKDIPNMRVGNMCIMILILVIVVVIIIYWAEGEFSWKGTSLSLGALYLGVTLGYNLCLNDIDFDKHNAISKKNDGTIN